MIGILARLPPRAVSSAAVLLALAPWSSATARGDSAPAAPAPFIELTAAGRVEGRFDAACGTTGAEVIDPESSSPRLVVSGSCGGVVFDVVAHPKTLPGSLAPDRVRFLDIATGQERIASSAKLDVVEFGDVGGIVAGRIELSMPQGLNRPATQIRGTFRLVRGADRFSP